MDYGNEIWFVDDDRIFQFIVEKYLEGSAFEGQYKMFDDGDRTLLELIGRAKRGEKLPNIIFLDLRMKYMEGWETLDFLNETAKTKVVILTSSVSSQDQKRAKEEPLVVDYLTKPIDKNQLLLCIRKHLSPKKGGSQVAG